ncbi:MAG: hypothetical protein AB7F59_07320 [Bdellovibrionales bacterium]
MNKFFAMLAVVSFMALAGCEEANEDKIASAQACLDTATNATVSVCEAMVAGVTGARAAVIRCSAAFISQNFTASRFANAFITLKEQTSGQNATLGMMSYLVFNYGTDNTDRLARVNAAVAACDETGLPGMRMFANFAKASTVLACGMPGLTIDPSNPPTPAELQANLATFNGSNADLGTSVLAVADSYCGTTSSTSNAAFCTQVNDAAASGDPAAVGQRIRDLLAATP